MRFVEAVSEDYVVAHFLRHEIQSKRWEDGLIALLNRDGKERSVIEEPNLGDAGENAYRVQVLGEFRGYKRGFGLFAGFPESVSWGRFWMNASDLRCVRYVDYSYWNELSGGSRLPVDAARRIKAGMTVFGQSVEPFVAAAEALKAGNGFPELILVGRDRSSPLVVLEGHLRLTAYFLAMECIPEEMSALVGLSRDMSVWM